MNFPRLVVALLTLLAVSAVLAACGDDAPSDEDYFRRMDEVDKEVDARFENINCDETTTARECATGFGDGVSFAESKLDEVKPSKDAEEEHEELLAAIRELREKIESAELQEDDPADAFFESGAFDTARVDASFCAIQELADQKGIAADVGCGSGESVDPSTPPPVEATDVSIQDFAFDPPHIQVSVGDTVTWTQGTDEEPHTATADDGTFDTGNLTDEGESGEFTFEEAGEFSYFCEIHPEMLGLVTVVE